MPVHLFEACCVQVLGQSHTNLELAFTRALKMWESGANSSPSKKLASSSRSGAVAAAAASPKQDVADKTRLYDAQQSHVALACRIEQQYQGTVQFESGQRVSFIFCHSTAAAAKKASTRKQQQPALHA